MRRMILYRMPRIATSGHGRVFFSGFQKTQLFTANLGQAQRTQVCFRGRDWWLRTVENDGAYLNVAERELTTDMARMCI
jgi:Tol biopolymer transport system component